MFDVNETLSDLKGLAPRFQEAGIDPRLLPVWFAATLRDGFAITAAGGYADLAQIAVPTLAGLVSGTEGLRGSPEDVAERIVQSMAELDLHDDVAEGLRGRCAPGCAPAGYRETERPTRPTCESRRQPAGPSPSSRRASSRATDAVPRHRTGAAARGHGGRRRAELPARRFRRARPARPRHLLESRVGTLLADLARACYQAYALDFPGFGHSGGRLTRAEASVPALARCARRFLDAIGVTGSVIVGGHDIGGAVAHHLPAHEPSATRLVLMNSVLYDSWPVPAVERFRDQALADTITVPELLEARAQSLARAVTRPLSDDERETWLGPGMSKNGSTPRLRWPAPPTRVTPSNS